MCWKPLPATLILWVTNYAHNRTFFNLFIASRIPSFKKFKAYISAKIRSFLEFIDKNPSCCLWNISKLSYSFIYWLKKVELKKGAHDKLSKIPLDVIHVLKSFWRFEM